MKKITFVLFLLSVRSLTGHALPTPALQWSTLSSRDPKEASPAALKAWSDKLVRVPGYLVPLEYDQKATTEFLLVPSLPACAHVPPPSPLQTVHVKMQKGKNVPLLWDPVWIFGTVKSLKCDKAGFGEACYEMVGAKMEKVTAADLKNPQLFPPPPLPPNLDCKGRDKNEVICTQMLGIPDGPPVKKSGAPTKKKPSKKSRP